jgi:hypothetical protein
MANALFVTRESSDPAAIEEQTRWIARLVRRASAPRQQLVKELKERSPEAQTIAFGACAKELSPAERGALLALVVMVGYEDWVEAVLEAGASVNEPVDADGNTVLMAALRTRPERRVVEAMLPAADANAKNKRQERAIDCLDLERCPVQWAHRLKGDRELSFSHAATLVRRSDLTPEDLEPLAADIPWTQRRPESDPAGAAPTSLLAAAFIGARRGQPDPHKMFDWVAARARSADPAAAREMASELCSAALSSLSFQRAPNATASPWMRSDELRSVERLKRLALANMLPTELMRELVRVANELDCPLGDVQALAESKELMAVAEETGKGAGGDQASGRGGRSAQRL